MQTFPTRHPSVPLLPQNWPPTRHLPIFTGTPVWKLWHSQPNCHQTTNLAAVLSTPAAKATVGVLDPSAPKPQSTERRPRYLFNPEHLHPSRHLRIDPGTTHRLLRSAVRKATIRGQHSRNESPPMHLAWRPGQRPRFHLAWLQEVA
ncbi:hypothetical protein MRX96_017837 [Rhipicephalus microplus]